MFLRCAQAATCAWTSRSSVSFWASEHTSTINSNETWNIWRTFREHSDNVRGASTISLNKTAAEQISSSWMQRVAERNVQETMQPIQGCAHDAFTHNIETEAE
jgi:hypothetical protein